MADVLGIECFLNGQITVAARRDLPEPGQARRNASSKAQKLSAELLKVVTRKWPWPDEAHLSPKHIPELWQLVQARSTQQLANPG